MSFQSSTKDGTNDAIAKTKDAATQAKEAALTSIGDLKTQASQAADDARGTLNTMASEAREKVADIVAQQKSTGAEHLSGIARAAQTAAGDLDEKNPAVANLVRDAASSVDRFATDLRDRDLRDVLASVTDFAKQQPVAFFAGSVLAGFVLARFLKSEARSVPQSSGYQGSQYRDHTL